MQMHKTVLTHCLPQATPVTCVWLPLLLFFPNWALPASGLNAISIFLPPALFLFLLLSLPHGLLSLFHITLESSAPHS